MSRQRKRIRWTEESLRHLKDRVIAWAPAATMAWGRFSIAQATEALLGGRNKEPVAQVVRELEEEGLAEPYGRLGFRWIGVDAPPVRRRSAPYLWTEDRLLEELGRLRGWVAASRGEFTRQDVASSLGTSSEITKRLLKALHEEGVVQRTNRGYMATGETPESGRRQRPWRWTDESLGELRARLEEYAEETTRSEGGITIRKATADLLDVANTEPVRLLVRALEREGKLVFLSQRRGWAWATADRPVVDPRIAPRLWTPEAVTDLAARVEEYAKVRCREHGRFTISGATDRLGLSYREPVAKVVRSWVEVGKAVDLGPKYGYALLGVVSERLTASALLAHAQANVEDGEQPRKRGRKGSGKSHQVTSITKDQLKDVGWAVRNVLLPMEEGSLDTVGSERIVWDPAADGGAGNWAILTDVRAWMSRPESSYKSDAVAKAVRSIELLLDLAATHGLLGRQECHVTGFEVYAAEWHPIIAAWQEELLVRDPVANVAKVRMGLRVIANYATRLHYLSWETTDWKQVRALVEEDYEAWQDAHSDGASARAGLKQTAHDAVRYVWRRTPELEALQPWELLWDRRTGLIENQAILSAARTGDFSGWVGREGKCLATTAWDGAPEGRGDAKGSGLVESEYGLRRWKEWVTLDASKLSSANLPERAWPDPDEGQQIRMNRARRRKKELFRCREATLVSRFGHTSLYAGWAVEHDGFDPHIEDLRHLVDPERMQRYIDWREQNPTRSDDPEGEAERKRKGLDNLVLTFARIASPFLEGLAKQNGEVELREKMRQAARELTRMGYEKRPPRNESKHIREIYRLWSADGRNGYLKLCDLTEILVAEACEMVGMSLEDTVAAIRAGTLRPPLKWAVAIRGATLVHCERKIPLRARTATLLEMKEWENYAVTPDQLGRSLQKWEGAISYRIEDGRKLKSGRDGFKPAMIEPADVGNADAEADANRPLLEAYFVTGGARDIVLTIPSEGKPRRSDYVFPAVACKGRRGRRKGERWLSTSMSEWFRRVVVRHARRLGLDVRALRKLHGALTLHIVRLLFGSHWVREGYLDRASLLLDHTDVGFTRQLYSGFDEASASLYLRESDRTKPITGEGGEVVQALRVENESLREQAERQQEQIGRLQESLASLSQNLSQITALMTSRMAAA